MPSALETLVKILKLEQDTGFQDKAVIGGLRSFGEHWATDAHAQAKKPDAQAIKARHASFHAQPKPQQVPPVTFNQSRQITGSEHWQGEKYAAFRDFRVDPKGYGLHGMTIPPGEVVRLTEAGVLAHPLWRGFGQLADAHPPMRGWLATSVCGDDGRVRGLLQLSDKSGGRDFDESDEMNIRELAALVGETLEALRLAARQPA